MKYDPRNTILVIGEFDFTHTPFIERNLYIKKVKVEDASKHFNHTRGIIVVDYPNKFRLINQFFDNLFIESQHYGIAPVVLYHSDSDIDQIKAIIDQAVKSDYSFDKMYSIGEISAVAEYLARYEPGPPVSEVIIEPPTVPLEQEIMLLLQRSFCDCERIHLEPIGGGKASMHLFKVHAWLKQSEVGPLPLPFFVKVAGHVEIRQEMYKYSYYTDHYISFQYRPNLRLERCVSTAKYSSLVGNFVDESVPLRSALKESHHSGILWSLFEKTLRGFRLQPIVSQQIPSKGAISEILKWIIWAEKLLERDDVISLAKSIGLGSEVTDLIQNLIAHTSLISCYTGPMHGDLHAGNVIVRGTDAILIDFYSVTSGPLTADPINLEISLTFAIGEREENRSHFEIWKKFIDEVYEPKQILKPLSISDRVPDEYTWLKRAVREIRHILVGCPCCHDELKAVFAGYLLRYARLASREIIDNEEKRISFSHHAYALVIAERIILSLGDTAS